MDLASLLCCHRLPQLYLPEGGACDQVRELPCEAEGSIDEGRVWSQSA